MPIEKAPWLTNAPTAPSTVEKAPWLTGGVNPSDQALGIAPPDSAPPVPPQKKGLVDSVFDVLGQAGQGVKDAYDVPAGFVKGSLADLAKRATESGTESVQAPTKLEKALRMAGQGAGFVGDMFNRGTEAASKVLSSIPGAANLSDQALFSALPESWKKTIADIAGGTEQTYKKVPERVRKDLEAVANIASVVPFAKVAEVAAPALDAIRAGAKDKVLGVAKLLENLGSEKGELLTPQQQYQNAAAQKINMPLTKGEEVAAAGSKIPGGPWGAVERSVRSLPGAGGVFEKLNADKTAAAIKAIETMYGSPISELDDNAAKQVADNIEKSVIGQKNLFAGAYDDAIKNGKVAYIDGQKAALKIQKKLLNSPDYTTLSPKTQSTISGFVNKLYNINKAVTKEGGVGSNYEQYRYLQSDVGSTMRQLSDKLYQGSQAISPSEASRAIKSLKQIKDTMKANEYNHLRIIGGNDLVNNLKTLDRLYSNEASPMKTVQKMFGVGKGIGEKGYVEGATAVDKMLNAKNLDKLNIAMNYMDDETKGLLAKDVVGNIIKNSSKMDMVNGKPVISQLLVGRFEQNVKKYRPVLEKVLSPEQLQQIDDTVTGIRRGNVSTVNMLDPGNPSGTGAKNALVGMAIEAALVGTAGGMGTHHIAAMMAGIPIVGAQMYGANVLARMAAKQGLSGIERLPGAIAGGVGNVVKPVLKKAGQGLEKAATVPLLKKKVPTLTSAILDNEGGYIDLNKPVL